MNSTLARGRLAAAIPLVAVSACAIGQSPYPNRAIRLIVPYAPGGSVDPLARVVSQKLTESWGQQIVVDNRPGGNSIIGTEAVVRSKPDGYTLLLTSGAHVINPNLISSLPYDAIKDFAPVATVSSSEIVLVINPSLAATTLQEFIALAKSKPGQLNFGTGGVGSGVHLAGELFNITLGTRIQHVPYKGGAQAISPICRNDEG